MKNIGIVLAGGIGRRFGGDKPKQYFEICGKEMIAYSIELFRAAKMNVRLLWKQQNALSQYWKRR